MRFNIRESAETDSEGNPLSPEQIEFFKNSKIRRYGKLMVCYHNTNAEFDVFDKSKIGTSSASSFGKGFYFADNSSLASNYGGIQKQFYLNITNPFYYDSGIDFLRELLVHSSYKYDEEKVSEIESDDLWEYDFIDDVLAKVLIDADPYKVFSEMCANAGYDGIWADAEIIAFDPNQIKSITNKTPTNSDNINEDNIIEKDHTSGVTPTQKYQNRKAKKTVRQIAKELNNTQGIDCSFVVDAKSMTVHHIDDTKGEDGLKNNSFDNLWFICSDDSRDSEVVHKLLHYIERKGIGYDDLLKELGEIRIFKYDEPNGKFITKTLQDFKECCESLNKGLKEDMANLKEFDWDSWGNGRYRVLYRPKDGTGGVEADVYTDWRHKGRYQLVKIEGERIDGVNDKTRGEIQSYIRDHYKSTQRPIVKEDMDLNFDRALLDKWIDDLNAKGAKYHQTFSYTEGGKYIRVSYTYGGRYDNAVFAFVDADGNIYKPASWKTPAKGVRARIDQNPPMDEKDLYSARYRAAVYGESVNEAYNKDSLHAKLWNMEHKEQTCFQNGYCVTCYFHDGKGMAKRYTVTNRDGKKVLDCNAGFAWQPQIQKFEDSLLQLLNTGSIKEEILTEKPSPAGYEPTKKGIAYKVFKVKNGKLYPPMVANAGGADTPIGVWLDAEEGEFAGLSKTGRPQVKSTGSGNLSYRPGWHLGDIPRAKQFDRLNKETGEYEFPKDFVWAECEYAMDVDYQPESDARGYERTKVDKDGNVIVTKSDKYQHSLAGLPKLPTNGYYKYRTNPNPDTVPWVITGQMKVNRLLSDAEVNAILEKNGIEPIHRQGGDKTLAELGLKEGLGEDWYFHDDDSYFSHEQLLDFASDLEDAIQARHGRMFTVTSVWFEKDNSLVADVQIGKYGDDMLVTQKVDMRRVKTEKDLRKYIPTLVDQVTKQAVDDNY